jgi:hypothetical protein
MGLIPDQLRRELRGPTIGSKRRAQIVGVSSYLLGAFVFIYLTWYHCEENPTQVTYMIELDVAGEPATPPPTPPCDQEAEANIVGCRPRDHNSSAANKEDFWGAVSHIMNTGRKPGESEQLVPEASLESCEFFMQPAMRVGMGKQAPTGTNLTHHFITRPIESFLVVTCVQKTTLGEAAGLSAWRHRPRPLSRFGGSSACMIASHCHA